MKKEKKKRESNDMVARMGYCPFFGLCHDRVPWVLGRDRLFPVVTGRIGQEHD